MSAIPPKADIRKRDWDVRFGPEAEVAVIRSVELIVQPDAQDVVVEMRVRGARARTDQRKYARSKGRRSGVDRS
jgi:hypothetical protein